MWGQRRQWEGVDGYNGILLLGLAPAKKLVQVQGDSQVSDGEGEIISILATEGKESVV